MPGGSWGQVPKELLVGEAGFHFSYKSETLGGE